MSKLACSLHTTAADEETSRLKNGLDPRHVIHTMICEHEKILGYLSEIEKASGEIQRWTRLPDDRTLIEALRGGASHLIAAEPHHQREEEVLFPELERRGLVGPPAVMRQEHVELRGWKHRLKELADSVSERSFGEFLKHLPGATNSLVSLLRTHIDKENHILYPMALQVISAKEDWARMKIECDRIGYCCFTPKR